MDMALAHVTSRSVRISIPQRVCPFLLRTCCYEAGCVIEHSCETP